MINFKKDFGKKDEEETGLTMYSGLEKTAVLQEARMFNETPLNPRRCITVLTKLLCIISQGSSHSGERLSKIEATDAFFAITKLFQHKDVNMRRMVYLVIKEMADIADNVMMVTSMLLTDMNGPEPAFHASSIRALCKVTDPSMLQSIERYMRQNIVSKTSSIASATLISAYHLMSKHHAPATDMIRHWAHEVNEAASSDSQMVQYHGMGLLYQLRRNDRLAVVKMIQRFATGGSGSGGGPSSKSSLAAMSLRSVYAHCLMIRIVAKQLHDESATVSDNSGGGSGGGLDEAARARRQPLIDFLDASLRHKSEMVIYEAARALATLPHISSKELVPAINVLQVFTTSHKPSLCFAAARTLNRVAMRHPTAVAACNLDLEALISNSNRSIATLAITTLLKTGSESSVDRLLKQIGSFMSEITEEFKVVVVDSVRVLAVKYPAKYAAMLTFLSGLLRENVGFKFKKAVVLAIEAIMAAVPESTNMALLQLCEFIEDCEHVELTQRVLDVLGREGPRMRRPRKFIRYVYNRVVLEDGLVRCAAVTALARFGAACGEGGASDGGGDLRAAVRVLLKRTIGAASEDDEVRDRAAFYLHLLRERSGEEEVRRGEKEINDYILQDMQLDVAALEHALANYVAGGSGSDATKQGDDFDLSLVPLACMTGGAAGGAGVSGGMEDDLAGLGGVRRGKDKAGGAAGVGGGAPGKAGAHDAAGSDATRQGGGGGGAQLTQIAQRLHAAIPELQKIVRGAPLFKSSGMAPLELTEAGMEYEVVCVKHVFPSALVLQFDCVNTLDDRVLQQVRVVVQPMLDGDVLSAPPHPDSEGGGVGPPRVVAMVPCERLEYNAMGSVYVVLRLPEIAQEEVDEQDAQEDEEEGGGGASVPAELEGVYSCELGNTLHFLVNEGGGGGGGYPDDFALEEVQLELADSMQRIVKTNFASAWNELANQRPAAAEVKETFELANKNSIADTIKSLVDLLGMQPQERSDRVATVAAEGAGKSGGGSSTHTLLLAGVFRGGHEVLARCRMVASRGITLEFVVRSQCAPLCRLLADSIG